MSEWESIYIHKYMRMYNNQNRRREIYIDNSNHISNKWSRIIIGVCFFYRFCFWWQMIAHLRVETEFLGWVAASTDNKQDEIITRFIAVRKLIWIINEVMPVHGNYSSTAAKDCNHTLLQIYELAPASCMLLLKSICLRI